MSKERATQVSVSMPKSLVKLVQKRLDREYPPRTLSRYCQELIADDLREAGILGGNGQRKPELAHV
jgi:hypothetical protein